MSTQIFVIFLSVLQGVILLYMLNLIPVDLPLGGGE